MLTRLDKFKDNLLKFGVAAILIAVPLYQKFPFLKIPGTYVSIRLEDFLIFFISLFWLASINFDIRKLFENRVGVAIALFWAIGLVSIISGIFLTETVSAHIGILHWGRRIEYMIGFYIGYRALADRANLSFFVKCLMIVVFAVFLYGLGQKYLSWPVITTQNDEYSKGVALRYMPGGHLVSTFAGHYDMATYMILVLPLFITVLVLPKAIRSLNLGIPDKFAVLVVSIVVACGMWLLMNSASRISLVSFVLSVTISLFLLRKYKAISVFFVVTIIFASLTSNLTARYGQIFDVLSKKINSSSYILNPIHNAFAEEDSLRRKSTETPPPAPVIVIEDRSTSIRLNVEWPRAIRAFTKNPFLGTGLSSITLATDNDYLRLLGEVGILGFLGFFLIFVNLAILVFKKVWKLKTFGLRTAFVVGMAGAIPGVFLNGMFIDVFESSKLAIVFWFMIGFLYSLVELQDNETDI